MYASPQKPQRRGLTLVEMVMVLVIVAALAAMVVPLVSDLRITTAGGQEKSPEQIATEATMQKIRDAIMGTPNHPGAWADLGQRPELFPQSTSILSLANHPAVNAFDPVTKIGWRGPYLVGHSSVIDAWGSPIVIQVDFDRDGLVSTIESRYVRLVSAGADKQLETPADASNMIPGSIAANELTLAECGDDLVLFLRVSDARQ